MRELEGEFRCPDRPLYRACRASVLWEPMLGSGERLTAVIGALGADGQVRVIQAIRPEVLEAAFGARSEHALGLLRLVGESLGDHLERRGDFAGWAPPLAGFFVGAPVDAWGDDLDGALRQAVQLGAAFGSLERLEVLAESGQLFTATARAEIAGERLKGAAIDK